MFQLVFLSLYLVAVNDSLYDKEKLLMGSKTSTQNYQQGLSLNDENFYSNNFRPNTTWDHRQNFSSNNVPSVSNIEIKNVHRHHQLTPKPIIKRSHQKDKTAEMFINEKTQRNNPGFNSKAEKEQLSLRKSRSHDNFQNSTNIVTADQLLNNRVKQNQRNRSPTIQMHVKRSKDQSIENASSSIKSNQKFISISSRKKVPANLDVALMQSSDFQVNNNYLFSFYKISS